MFKNKNKKVEAEKETKKEYEKKLNKLIKKVIKNPLKSTENLKEIINLLEEMKDKKVITEEKYKKNMDKIHNNLNAPEEFKEWLRKKESFLKNKFQRAFKRNKQK